MIPLGLANFLLLGVVLVLVGAHQAQLAEALDLDLAASGLLGSAVFLGLGVGVVGAGPLVDRLPRRPIFVAACALAAFALLGIDEEIRYPRALLSLMLLGLGVGVCETLLNAVLAERHLEHAARPLTLVHGAANLGAVLAPPLFAWMLLSHDWTASFRATGVGFAGLALAGLVVHLGVPPVTHRAPAARAMLIGIAPFAFATVCYVGIETSLTLFAVPYTAAELALPEMRGVHAISALWLGMLLGRAALLVYRGPVDARLLLLAGGCAAVLLALCVVGHVRQIEAMVGAIGLCLGIVFPLLIALTAQRFPAAPGTATGLVAGAGALGGIAVPWLTGWIGDQAGLRIAFLSLVPWCLAIAGAAWVTLRANGRPSHVEEV